MLATLLSRTWWLLLVRGIASILFGVAAWSWPRLTVLTLVSLFAAYAFVDGVAAIVAAVRGRGEGRLWWLLLLEGAAGVGAGVLTWLNPGVTALVLLYFVGAWALVTGILEIVAAVQLRKDIRGEWLLGLAGVASVMLGLLLFLQPAAAALAVVWLLAGYALVFGATLVLLAFEVRSLARRGAPASRSDARASRA